MPDKHDHLHATETITKTKVEVKPPPMFKVLFHNDDYTPMDFVVDVLCDIFNKTRENASRIMLQVHFDGVGIAGIYPFEIAETKIEAVRQRAKAEGHPLRCSLEED